MQRIPLFLLSLLFFTACNSNPSADAGNGETSASWTPPASGTVVASDSMKIEDKLNDFYFAVKLTTSHNNDKPGNNYGFIYDVDAHFGPNDAMSEITMPKGGKNLKPVLQKAEDEEYGYILGFIPSRQMGGDGKTFQPYYLVRAVKAGMHTSIEIKALKQYSFD